MAAWRSAADRNMPRFSRRFVSIAKNPSTALSQDAEVGVKWKLQWGWRASHWRTLWMFVRCVIVDDGVDYLSRRNLFLDGV